ncbi:MAG: two-component regulator propeller domain-containing protein, partial [Bacteroides sp.]
MSDKQGNLWMCTHSKGVEKITFVKSDFKLYIPIPHDYETLGNDVRSLYTDKDQRLWVGIKSGSVRVYDKNMEYLGYLTEAGTIAKSGKGIVGVAYCITQDSRGVMWIATKGDGLVRAVKEGDKYKLTRYKNEPDNIYSLSDNNIYSIYEDGKKRLWLATFGGGLNYIEPEKKGELTFINYRNDLKGYPIDYCHRVRHITSDSKHNIWVATTTGVLCFNENFVHPEKVVFSHYSRIPSEAGSLSNNDVYWILETKRKELYLATFGGGLNKLVSMEEQGKAKFKSYTVKDGLPSDVLLSIQEDKKGNLWISTENGLSKFSPARQTSENYDEKGFDLKVRFDEGSSSQLYNNQIAFGTSYGIFFFSPDSIRKSSYVPPITFSKLQIANIETVPGAEGSVLERNINETDNLELSHDENIFTITYAALDLKNPDNIQYAYILEGFDKDWTYVDKQRSATYTNIPKGEY